MLDYISAEGCPVLTSGPTANVILDIQVIVSVLCISSPQSETFTAIRKVTDIRLFPRMELSVQFRRVCRLCHVITSGPITGYLFVDVFPLLLNVMIFSVVFRQIVITIETRVTGRDPTLNCGDSHMHFVMNAEIPLSFEFLIATLKITEIRAFRCMPSLHMKYKTFRVTSLEVTVFVITDKGFALQMNF